MNEQSPDGFIEKLTREELMKLLKTYAKNWLAHDGCWFLGAEETYGLEGAIELDKKAWHRFAVAEARRIMKDFSISERGGVSSLAEALKYRLYHAINPQKTEWVDERTICFTMLECRVQRTRTEKQLPAFPCKQVGMVEFSQFAKAIDPRIQTRCLFCPPDPSANGRCSWEFTLGEFPAEKKRTEA